MSNAYGTIRAESVKRGGQLVYYINWTFQTCGRDYTLSKDSSGGKVFTLASPPASTGSGPDRITWLLREEDVFGSDDKFLGAYGILKASGAALPLEATVAVRVQQEGRECSGSSEGAVTLAEGGELRVQLRGGTYHWGPCVLRCEVTPSAPPPSWGLLLPTSRHLQPLDGPVDGAIAGPSRRAVQARRGAGRGAGGDGAGRGAGRGAGGDGAGRGAGRGDGVGAGRGKASGAIQAGESSAAPAVAEAAQRPLVVPDCGICYDRPAVGVMMPCQHNACIQCIKRIEDAPRELVSFRCPFCNGNIETYFNFTKFF